MTIPTLALVRKIIDKNKWKLRVAVVAKSTGFCFFYRLKWPLEALEKKGLIETIGVDWSNEKFRENKGKYMSDVLEWADVIVFQQGNPHEVLIRYSDLCNQKKIPKLFISEHDDDFSRVHPSNPYYREGGLEEIKLKNGKYVWKDNDLNDFLDEYKDKTEEEKKLLMFNTFRNKATLLNSFRSLMYSDIITTTTPELASVFFNWNQNVVVLPNFINPRVMPKENKKKRDHILIGWQGGDSHHQDLKMIMPALKAIKNKYKNKVKFVFMGSPFINMYSEIDGEFIKWIAPEKFYKKFSENIFDIGLIPLVDPRINEFNNSKSNIKWLEYSQYAIPSVVSGYKPYVQHIEHEKTGLLCYTVEDWYNSIEKLIEDPIYRFKLGSMAKMEVDGKFKIQNHAQKWYDLYMNALQQKVERFLK